MIIVIMEQEQIDKEQYFLIYTQMIRFTVSKQRDFIDFIHLIQQESIVKKYVLLMIIMVIAIVKQLQFNQVMNEQSFISDGILAQVNIYDDLSHFIKTFKRIMESTMKIVAQTQQLLRIKLIQELKKIPNQNIELTNRYNFIIQDGQENKNTFYRFVCRLNQTIEIYKNLPKYKTQISILHKEFLDKVQKIILQYENEKNIGLIFKKIFSFTKKFCQSCCLMTVSKSQEQLVDIKKQQQEFFERKTEPSNIIVKTKMHFNNSESNFHKTMTILNKGYHAINCLNLDYNFYKTTYFQSRTQKQELYNECFERNFFIHKEISLYSKQFAQYLKKKSKLVFGNRKNNRLKHRQFSLNVTKNELEEKLQKNQKFLTQINEIDRNDFAGKTQQLPLLREKNYDGQQSDLLQMIDTDLKDIEVERRKTQYQIKKIYLTLDKIAPHRTQQPREIPSTKNMINRDKLKFYAALKVGKLSMRNARTDQSRSIRPLLGIRQIQCYNEDAFANLSFVLKNKQTNDTFQPRTQNTISNKSIHLQMVNEKQSNKEGSERTGLFESKKYKKVNKKNAPSKTSNKNNE